MKNKFYLLTCIIMLVFNGTKAQTLTIYPETRGLVGPSGRFGQIKGTVTGSNCSNQSATFVANTNDDAFTGFNLSTTQLTWTRILSDGSGQSLPMFDNLRTITTNVVGGYSVAIRICGDGGCTFRNTYISGTIYVASTPSAVGLSVNKVLNGLGQVVSTVETPIVNGAYTNCGGISDISTKQFPEITSKFNGFPSSYSWRKGNAVVLNPSSENSAINSASLDTYNSDIRFAQVAGVYTVTATNYCGNASQMVSVTTTDIPSFTLANSEITACVGGLLLIPVTTSGFNVSEGFTLQSVANPSIQQVITSTPVSINGITNNLTGVFRLTKANTCGNSFNTTVNIAGIDTRLSVQPTSATICGNNTHVFTPSINGNASVVYNWRNITTNTLRTTTSSNFSTSAAGTYSLTVSSGNCRSVASNATLTVKQVPTTFTNLFEESTLNCNGGFYSSGELSLEFSAGSSSNGIDEINKFYRNGVFLLSFTGTYSPNIDAITLMRSDAVVSITSTIENSCATVTGQTYVFNKPTVTSVNIPSSLTVNIGGTSPVINSTLVGIENGNTIGQWRYNGVTILSSDSKGIDSRYGIIEPNAVSAILINEVQNTDLIYDFVYAAKACDNHNFTISNPLRLTTNVGVDLSNSPAPVISNNIINTTASSALVTWSAVSGATSYCIEVYDDAELQNLIVSECGLTNPEFTIVKFRVKARMNEGETTYFYRVAAENNTSKTPYSSAASVTLNAVSTSIQDAVDYNVSIYPIPSIGEFTLSSNQTLKSGDINLYDVFGISVPFTYYNNKLKVEKKGVFIVKIGTTTYKVVVE